MQRAAASQQHGSLSFRIGRDVVGVLDFQAGNWNVLGFIQPPGQHRRQHLGRVEQRFFLACAFGERVGQIDELNKKRSICLEFNVSGVSNVHVIASFEFDACLTL